MSRLLTFAALCCVALLAACDSDTAGTPTASATAEATSSVTVLEHPTPTVPPSIPSPTPEATPPSPPGPRRTGDPELDAIIEAVEERDVDALLGMVELQEVECRIEPDMTWHPRCEEGQADGTIVSGIIQSACEGLVNPDIRAVLEPFAREVDGFWAAVSLGDSLVYPDGNPDTLLVFHRWLVAGDGPPMDLAVYLAVRDGKVTGRGAACVGPLEELLNHPDRVVTAGPWHEPDFSGPRRTGDPVLDAIIEAVEREDVDALLEMLRTEEVECRGPDDPGQIGSPPACKDEGVPLGTVLTVATGAQCEGYRTTDVRGLVERWIPGQDGLYGLTPPTPDGVRLIFHGVPNGLNAGKGLWVEDGEIAALWFGCSQPARLVVPVDELTAGPWPEPLTPRVEAVRALMAPLLDAVEAGDASPLVEATEQNFLGHGCTTSRDPATTIDAFLESEPELVGIYEPEPRGWFDQWWLVFRLSDGDHARLLIDVRPRIEALFQPCDATLERVTQASDGEAAPLLWEPSE